jgi:hypothetical protein
VRRLDRERLTFLEETSRTYEIALTENPRALSYLSGRGVSTASIDRFRLGIVSDPPAEHRTMAGRIAIPTIKGVGITGFEFKCIRPECIVDDTTRPWKEHHEGHAKYLSYEPMALYNVAALDTDQGCIATVEGRFDCIILDGECGIPAVGLPGVASWRSHKWWRRLLKDFRSVKVFEDNDPSGAGKGLGDKIAEDLSQATRVELPAMKEGEKSDVSIVFCEKGRQFMRELAGV